VRIGFVTDKSGPEFVGGYEARIWGLVQRLAPRHDVRVFTESALGSREVAGAKFVRISPQGFGRTHPQSRSLADSVVFSLAAARIARGSWRPDVWVIDAIPYLHLEIARRSLFGQGIPVALLVDEAWIDYRYGGGRSGGVATRAIRAMLGRAVRAADLVVAVSNPTATALKNGYGARAVSVIPPGVDLVAIDAARPALPPERSPDVSWLGRLVPPKRASDLLEAIAILRRERGWTGTATIIGDGPDGAALRRQARGSGISDSVSFTGELPDELKYRSLWSSKVHVLTSEREGLSLSTLEAMACGRPVIVAQPPRAEVFGVSDLVEDGVNGLYYPVGATRSLADSIARLTTDPEMRAQMGARCRAKAEGLDWSFVAREFERQLARLARGG
jgi:glycosyltransferase involved in cell wall biosynthesis